MTILQQLPVLACIGFALFLSRRSKLLPAVALYVVTGAILFALFLAAVSGLLLPLSTTLLLVGLAVLAREAFQLYRLRAAPPLSLIVFFLASLLFWFAHNDASFFYYDAFSHWGIFLREVLASDGLWTADTNSVHPKYPPAPTLWQYWFARYSPALEGAAFHAQFVLLITPLMILFESIGRQRMPWIAVLLCLTTILLFNFGHGIQSVYVDHVLGTWVAGGIIAFLASIHHRSPVQLLLLSVPIAAISLIKTVGVFFVIIVSGAAVMATLGQWLHTQRKPAVAALGSAGLAVLLALLATVIWSTNRASVGIESDATSTDGMLTSLISGDSRFTAAQQQEITNRFVDVVLNQQIAKDEASSRYHAFSYPTMPQYGDAFRLTTATVMLLSLVVVAVLFKTLASEQLRIPWLAASLTLWAGTLAYLLVLYLGYVYVSESDNGLILSSYVRYSHSLILPLIIVVIAALFPVLGDHEPAQSKDWLQVNRNLAAVIAIIALFAVFETPYAKFLYTSHRSPDIRFAIEPTVAEIRSKIGDGSLQVFVDFQDPNGFLRHMIRYQFTPGRTTVEFADSAFVDDVRAYYSSRNDIDYLWVAANSEDLLNAVASASGGNRAARLFRIDRESDDAILVPVSFVDE